MRLLWWKRQKMLDAAGRRVLRSNLAELDYDLRRIAWDVGRVAKSDDAQGLRSQPAPAEHGAR